MKAPNNMEKAQADEVYIPLSCRYQSPMYVLDRQSFERNFIKLRNAFARLYSHIVIGYSYKTNYIPYLCRLARELGARAEVVSRLELDLALKLGYPPDEIIFNGPLKQVEDIESALKAGMVLNLDSFRELETAVDFARGYPGSEFRIGLRLNICLVDAEGTSHHQDGLPCGRFGFASADLERVKALTGQTPNLRIHSLHGHSSSTTRSLWVYRTIARTLAVTAENHFPDSIDMINVGGGFFGRPVPEMGLGDIPSYEDYAEAICGELQQSRWFVERQPTLVVEPGMAVVADTMSFVTKVVEVKAIGSRRLAVVDGTVFNVKPTLHKRNHPFQLIKANGASGRRGRYDVVGATCMEKDCLLQDIECEEIERGDFIKIDNVGAYTIVMTPPFIHPAPPILVREGEEYRVIRRRQEFADVFGTYTF